MIITEPRMHKAQPKAPSAPSLSSRKKWARMALVSAANKLKNYPSSTLPAPSGVTRIAGANEYAAKFAISPEITMVNRDKIIHTGHHSGPPQFTIQIPVAICCKTCVLVCKCQQTSILLCSII